MYRHSNLKFVDLINHGLDLMNMEEYKQAMYIRL